MKLDEAIPPAVLEGYKEIGIGCYLTCDELNQGTLYTHWSKTKIEGALAYFQPPPERKVPEHKFKSGSQGKNQFVKQIRGPMIQNYYKGWTMFAKEAKQWNADFVLLEDEDIQIVCNAGQAVTKLVSAKEQMLEIGDKVGAVVCVGLVSGCTNIDGQTSDRRTTRTNERTTHSLLCAVGHDHLLHELGRGRRGGGSPAPQHDLRRCAAHGLGKICEQWRPRGFRAFVC